MKINRFGLIPSAVLAVTSLCLTAHAATPNVDAGQLLRQNEQDSKALKPAPKASTTPAKPAPQASADEPTVLVQGFQFAGNTLLGTEQLNKAVAAYAGRNLTVAQLKEVADVVMNTYRQAGWTARAFLPKQEIEDGVVIIQVVEAGTCECICVDGCTCAFFAACIQRRRRPQHQCELRSRQRQKP